MKVGVVGAGSWGTALAHLMATKGHEVALWHREPTVAAAIEKTHQNPKYLKDIVLPASLTGTALLEEAVEDKELVISVVPSHAVREVMGRTAKAMKPDTIVLSASKGIENETLLTMHGVFKEIFPRALWPNLAFLGGPSFAREVAMKLPTAVSIAAEEPEVAKSLQQAFATPYLRAYTTSDVVGIELGGALKNVLAIGAGIAEGLKFGHNTRAALITRGLAEMARMGMKMGANPLTFAGLGGIGDLILTCTGDLSRNRKVGLLLGQGKTLAQVREEMDQVAEGIKTAVSVEFLARRLGVDMPLCHEVYAVLYENKDAKAAVIDLMTRTLKDELG
jgi:glycerol-3-phosphate dehydrogenase (NAD(P)+)